MCKKTILILSSFLFILNCCFIKQTTAQDHAATLQKLADGLGNKEALNEAPYFMFECNLGTHDQIEGGHTFIYDWKTANCRFEGQTNEGENLVVLFNARTQIGKVYINKKQAPTSNLLETVVKLFDQDSYYLFTPVLVATKALKSSLEEAEIIDSKRFLTLRVHSKGGKIGSSKLSIDSQTGQISRWVTYNPDGEKIQELIVSAFKDIGSGLILGTKFTNAQNGNSFQYPVVSALINIEVSKFKSP